MNIAVAIILFFAQLTNESNLLASLPPLTPREQYVQGCWDAYWAAVAAANKRYSDNPRDPNRQQVKDTAMKAARQAKAECYANGRPPVNPNYPEPRPKPRKFDIVTPELE